MSTFTVKTAVPYAENVTVRAETLYVELSDGRTISVPLDWYPSLRCSPMFGPFFSQNKMDLGRRVMGVAAGRGGVGERGSSPFPPPSP